MMEIKIYQINLDRDEEGVSLPRRKQKTQTGRSLC